MIRLRRNMCRFDPHSRTNVCMIRVWVLWYHGSNFVCSSYVEFECWVFIIIVTNIIIMFIFHRHINQSSPNYKDAVSRKQQFPIRDESNTFDNIRVCSLAAIKCFFV